MVLVSAIILFLLFRKCDWVELWGVLRQINVLIFIVGFIFALLAYIASAYRWKILCHKSSVFDLYKLLFVSRLYSTILPGQMFGEGSKILYLIMQSKKRGIDLPAEEAASSVVVDKIVGLIGMIIVGVTGCLFSNSEAADSVLMWLLIF